MINRNRPILSIVALLVVSVLTVCMSMRFGAADLNAADSEVFWRVRVPRVLLGFIVGAGLALAGGVFQTLFRTPLATPFTLGVAGGASLGAALYLTLIYSFIPSSLGLNGAAFLGALLTVVLLFTFQRLLPGLNNSLSLLLVGVMLNFFFSSLILFLQYIGDFTQVFRISRWMMGSLETVDFRSVGVLALGISMTFLIVLYFSRALDLLLLGEEISISRGVNIRLTYAALLVSVSICTAMIVARCGVIGFVGMIVPYVCRLLVGSSHRVMLSASFLSGGIFLVLCDAIGRTIIRPAEIPVGVITALVGAPCFLGLLLWGGSRGGLIARG